MLQDLSLGVPPVFAREISRVPFNSPDRCTEHPALGVIRFRRLGPSDGPPSVVLGGISADRRIDEWWSGVVGQGGPLDPDRHQLIAIDWLERGSGSATFASTEDQADAIAWVLDRLGITRPATLVGASYGAMVGLAFAARHGELLKRLIAISGAHRSTAHASALRLLQRRIIRDYADRGQADEGVAVARAIALTGYRPAELFERRFHAGQPARVLEQLESYFQFNGARFTRRFDARRYLALSESIDHHRVDPRAIRCPVEAISVDSDTLVPPAQMKAMVAAIGCHARLHCLGSRFGHDAFLKSISALNRLLRPLLNLSAGEVT